MAKLNRLVIAFKALRQLGLQQVGLYALYKFGLMTGHYRRAEEREQRVEIGGLRPLFTFPTRDELLAVLGKDGKTALLAEADEIASGKVRLFGGEPVDLQLTLPGKLAHWTAYETGKVPLPVPFPEPANLPTCDVKRVWEPARFGWAFTLGRAYHISQNEKYAETFWRNFETFTDANPPCLGPHWMSGQEAALRLMAFVWAGQVFDAASASTPERKRRLADSVAAHAARIPPTLAYARSQHNNHLLTESAGLLTAGLALPDHPDAARWRALGWRWLNDGLQSQIDGYGEYAQHSTNYHRLMLQVILWTNALCSNDLSRYRWPRQTREAVERSVHWLLSLMDSETGRTPNLGANDGAYIFPLTISPFSDFRPVTHAAARIFLDYDLPRGPWDEMALWFGAQAAGAAQSLSKGPKRLALPRYIGDQLYGKQSWAYFRTAQFTSRPSHADQLHLDLWWRGLNVAQDAGTYLYNAPAPWDNSLTAASVHNTVTVDGRDQFTRAGRFLYLDWFNAYRTSEIAAEPEILQRVSGRYRAGGFRHTRTVTAFAAGRWLVEDEILRLAGRRKPFTARLHWLLPDWEWKIENREQRVEISLKSPYGIIRLNLSAEPLFSDLYSLLSIVRAGEPLLGSSAPDPARGWTSPTYGVKIPALSLAVIVQGRGEISFSTEFIFPTNH
ncbi:MAG: hypothetical protein FD146_117 [Anaerolineaceae bacterium]|nr:MAG: hypothetical protein FD146_117 [Anaerolineaceae bacterium]